MTSLPNIDLSQVSPSPHGRGIPEHRRVLLDAGGRELLVVRTERYHGHDPAQLLKAIASALQEHAAMRMFILDLADHMDALIKAQRKTGRISAAVKASGERLRAEQIALTARLDPDRRNRPTAIQPTAIDRTSTIGSERREQDPTPRLSAPDTLPPELEGGTMAEKIAFITAANGRSITVLCFALERAIRDDDGVATLQIKEALTAAYIAEKIINSL